MNHPPRRTPETLPNPSPGLAVNGSSTRTTTEPVRAPWPVIDRLTADVSVRMPDYLGWYVGVKVVVDYMVSVLILPLALLLVGLAAIAVKLTSPGPVFYTQTRVGLNGRRYRILKIRTMHHNCEAKSGIRWSSGKGDSRVTRIGKFLRLTHIDELPQLWNVLKGEMSLVGPRPERPEVIQAKGLDHLVPGYKHRLLVKPGVTGFAQVQLPADTDITSVRYKIVYDLYYVQNQSLWLDMRLMAATLFKAFLSPAWLRRLFFLPDRDTLAATFQSQVLISVPNPTTPVLQPA